MLAILGKILLPMVVRKVGGAVLDKTINAKVKSSSNGEVYEKPWWQSKAMFGAVLLLVSFGARFFGYELTGTSIDQMVDMLLTVLVMFGRAKAVQ